jgi:cytochrome c oxidase subunit 2
VSKCGSCHTLAGAGTTGKVGPDLDAAFGPSREQGFKESTIRQIVRDQIHLPSPPQGSPGFPTMPANLVTGADADAVAAYVASVAGTGATPTPSTSTVTLTATAQTTTTPTTTGAAPSGGDAAKGKSLYTSLACSSCHSIDGSSGVGPTFKGLFGSKVQLTNGKTVTADDAYLLTSIEDPDAEIVKGYQAGIMSATIKPHQVAESDARDLIAFIKSLK